MTPSRAGETVSCYRQACGGTRAPGCGGRGPGPGPRPVDIGRGSGMVLRTVQHLASRQGELAARARLGQEPVDRPRCQAQRARADPVACWAGGWKREGPGRPVDNGERARCRRDGLRSEGMPGPSSLACLLSTRGPSRRATGHGMGAAPGRGGDREPRALCSVNIGANLAIPSGARAPMTPRNGSLQGSRARVAATPRGLQGKAGEVGWKQRGRDSSWPGGRHHAHVQRA
jgi:hypothetical protein